MAETLAIIPLWYGMVWCGGAGQYIFFVCFYQYVGENKTERKEKV